MLKKVNKIKTNDIQVPNKLLYSAKVNEQWTGIKLIKELTIFEREIKAFETFLSYISPIIKSTKKVNIIHIGTGNGCEIPVIKNNIDETIIQSYNLVDISEDFLNYLRKLIESNVFYNHNFFQRDVSLNDTSEFYNSISAPDFNLYILGGCGSLIEDDAVLKNILSGMLSDDYLILTLEYCSKDLISSVINEYSNPDVLRLFSSNLKQIGILETDCKYFNISINDSGYLIICFEYEKWLIDNGKYDDVTNVNSNIPTSITIFRSLKKDFNELHNHFLNLGFTVIKEMKYIEYRCCGFLLKKAI